MKKGYPPRQVRTARSPPLRRETQPASGKSAAQGNGPVETEQLHSASSLQRIINSSGIATLVLDCNLALCFFTPAASAQFKVTPAHLGRPLSEIECRFADDDLLLDAQTVIATGISLWREIQTDSGVWYNRRLLPYRGEDYEIRGAVITFADISELKAAQRENDAACNYANSIIDAIRQPLVVLDHELRIISASPSFYRGFAIKPDEAVGKHLPDLRGRCFDVGTLRSFLDHIAAGHRVAEDYEIEIDLPPRGKRVLLITARYILAVEPDKPRILLAIEDITERKLVAAEFALARMKAERTNRGKSRFLAAASHDLRQPLQTIFFTQGLLAAKIEDPDALKLVKRLGASMEVMSSLLNSLLDINQLEAGIIDPKIETFPIGTLLERLHADFSYLAEAKLLRFTVVGNQESVRSDPALLGQMIRNLISNALRYTDEGGILVGCRRRGAMLRVEVWDTGRGIPTDQFESIFEEFRQLDNPTRERSLGLGLGLSIVQRLASLLNYAIDVQSQPGKGTVFAIEVPCSSSGMEDGIDEKKLPQVDILQRPKSTHRNKSILIVEHDATLREMLQLLFEDEGYRTLVAADGNSALELIAHETVPPAVVVADYKLPNGLSGVDIAVRLRETFGRALPVLIITGDISTDALHAIATAGCVQLNMPFRADEITDLVDHQLPLPQPKSDHSQKHFTAPVPSGTESIVYLIDDDYVLRDAMRELIEQDGHTVAAFPNGEAFLEAYRPGNKACLLVDARLPRLGGIALLRRLRMERQDLPSIVITGHGEVSMVVEAMKAGAVDFIEKPVRSEDLLASIERALALAQNSSASSHRRDEAIELIAGLTPRERQIMEMVIAGHPNKIIAADMNVSQRTVENHRAAVMKKTGSKSLSDLVRLAITAA